MSSDEISFDLFRYDPSLAAVVTFIALFLLITIVHTYQMFCTRTWFFIPFVIGGCCQWIGYIGRAISSTESPNWTLPPYIIQTILPLVAPALPNFLVTNGEKYSIIKKKFLTKTFVASDIVSFLLQGGGGGIMASVTGEALDTGRSIIIGGLVVQVVIFSVFAITAAIFHCHMRASPTELACEFKWELHLYVLYSASLLIMVRSIFRLTEYVEGNDGYLISHEIFLYIFDSALMFACMVLLAWYHPSEINALLKGGERKAIRRVFMIYSPLNSSTSLA
uniref:RTA1 domain protein n=1 Tax=Bionectria ochroleuca TaxID=29856 RepID=A0A0B7K794_BIOOC